MPPRRDPAERTVYAEEKPVRGPEAWPRVPPFDLDAVMRSISLLPFRRFVIAVAAVLAVGAVPGPAPSLSAQELESPPDSAAIVADARRAQAAFERFRESRIPVSTPMRGGRCDERIGRLCIWFGGAGEADFPPEPIETDMARRDLIGALRDAAAEIRDPWVTGQLVRYLAEAEEMGAAERAARDCDLEAAWWCSALLGYVLHLRGDFVQAEAAFLDAVEHVPEHEVARWQGTPYVLSGQGRDLLGDVAPAERDALRERLWRFSNPLFLVDGNDRLTEHYARLVEAVNGEDSANAYDLPWEDDLAESLIRYGRTYGWSRVNNPPAGFGGGIQDTRRVVGHHDPHSRGYLFPDAYLEAPADIPPESWITAPREARTWYAPPYAPDFRGLDTQVARFRRDGEMLVVGAFRPTPPERDPFQAVEVPREEERWDPFGPAPAPPPDDGRDDGRDDAWNRPGPVRSGLFLVPEDGGEIVSVSGTDSEGVFTMRAPPGRYVSSVEVLEEAEGRAWRARQGVAQGELTRGLVAVSDLLLLEEGAPLPENLDQAIPYTRPGIRVARNERFTLAWEVYGLGVQEQVQVTLGFTAGRPGFLTRVGEFLGILEPDSPVEVTFTEPGPDQLETVFRAVQLEAPDVEPGEYTLHLRLELPGREPAVSSRPIVVEP